MDTDVAAARGRSAAAPPRRSARRRRAVYRLVKKLHMYLGLLNFSNLLVFGVAGLTATFAAHPEEGAAPGAAAVRYERFAVPPGLGDQAVADRVYRVLHLPLTAPVPGWAIRRDDDGHLLLNFHTVNGPHRVTVLAEEGRLRVATERNSVWRYLSNLHATTAGGRHQDWRLRLWSYNVELSIWSLLAMALSGLYLWLATRPRRRLAVNALFSGSGVFLLLYLLTR